MLGQVENNFPSPKKERPAFIIYCLLVSLFEIEIMVTERKRVFSRSKLTGRKILKKKSRRNLSRKKNNSIEIRIEPITKNTHNKYLNKLFSSIFKILWPCSHDQRNHAFF